MGCELRGGGEVSHQQCGHCDEGLVCIIIYVHRCALYVKGIQEGSVSLSVCL